MWETVTAEPADLGWVWDVVRLAAASAFGFAAGRGAIALDRRRARQEADADWSVIAVPGSDGPRKIRLFRAYVITNIGDEVASEVTLTVGNETLDAKKRFGKGEGEMLSLLPPGNEVLIEWTSHRGVRRGPVSRLLPPT